jgi:tRNA(Leu) C34 or U34 (ribose-2'-O)-methylase TrmL
MLVNQSISEGNFSDKLLATLDHVEYRRIQSHEDFEDIARLRYRAYKARNVLPVSAKSMLDAIDFDEQAYVFGVYYYEQLVSTLRIHHVTPDHRVSQSAGVFSEAINAFLDAGLTLIDPARFAVDPEFASERSAMPYLTVRPTIMAAIHFDADRMLQHIRPQHSAFYRRFFYADVVVPPTMTTTYGFELTLLASPTRELRKRLMRRFPAFQSEAYERRLMFGSAADLSMPPLTVLPTARLAGRPDSPEMAFLR